jgi:hypothetical protein
MEDDAKPTEIVRGTAFGREIAEVMERHNIHAMLMVHVNGGDDAESREFAVQISGCMNCSLSVIETVLDKPERLRHMQREIVRDMVGSALDEGSLKIH